MPSRRSTRASRSSRSSARSESMPDPGYKYQSLPIEEPSGPEGCSSSHSQGTLVADLPKKFRELHCKKIGIMVLVMVGVALFGYWIVVASSSSAPKRSNHFESCDQVLAGYQCEDEISHSWGQYSPFFTVPSEIPNYVPSECTITFAQILSRHGARDPTSSKTTAYNATIQQIQSNVTSYPGKYEFLANYTYTLGADQLTVFGQQELVNSGFKFFQRYEKLASNNDPFVRSSSEDRVVESAQNWTQGFHAGRTDDPAAAPDPSYPYPIVLISEDSGSNNTLDHGLCTSFEDGFDSTISDSAQAEFTATFIPAIQQRLNNDLPGANLTAGQTIYMMDLCPFNTVASPTGQISQFCTLFTADDWTNYDYYQTLGKYYGYSYGNPLGPTQGVGFTAELIARLTGKPVQIGESINSTLDLDPATFPLNKTLYADFTHDNDMTAIFSAMGLYNDTAPLSNETVESTQQTKGYSAAWTVPFAARMYVEKMVCGGDGKELVRVLINDRVIPLQNCGADKLGRCELKKFVESLGFVRQGGYWGECFANSSTSSY